MKKLSLILVFFTIFLHAYENSNLVSIYSEFTETITVKYKRVIKVKAVRSDYGNISSVENVVYYWNKITNNRDMDKLYNLYAPRVLYYGKDRKDTSCILDKKRFFKKHPLFHQNIDNLRTVRLGNNLYKVYFDKYVKLNENSRIKNYPSYLVVGYYSGIPYIYVEGDKITDRNLLKKLYKK